MEPAVTMPMENRTMTAQDYSNIAGPNRVVDFYPCPKPNPTEQHVTYERLQECYQHLSAMSENRRIPYSVLYSLHNHATKILRELKPANEKSKTDS